LNTLPSLDNSLGHIHLEGSKYGRAFNPTRVTISYSPFPRVRVFTQAASATASGSITYYNPATVPVNADHGKFLTASAGVGQAIVLQPLTAMPSWLSTLVTSYI
jgi:hypothetical protein